MSSLNDFDAALALAGIPGHRFGHPRRRGWRARRQPAWLGAGDHGSATLLNAHRQGAASTPPPAA